MQVSLAWRQLTVHFGETSLCCLCVAFSTNQDPEENLSWGRRMQGYHPMACGSALGTRWEIGGRTCSHLSILLFPEPALCCRRG